jgi:DtxR family Mn-dependent transcriptional regulator
MKDSHYSESVEMYLKTLATLGGGSEPVPIARIAERLDITTVSANEMVQRLARESLVAHQPYKGVTLTEAGRNLAHNVIRRERLWERFLVDRLKLDWALAHEWACQLEHATAPEVIDALDAFLDYPARCPQGNPIPRAGQALEATPGPLLSELAVGQTARLLAFEDESADVLSYLQKRSLALGSIVKVTEIAPKHGPLTLALAEREVVLGVNLAASIRVELISETL